MEYELQWQSCKKKKLYDPFLTCHYQVINATLLFFFPFLYLSFFFGQFRPTALFFSYSFFLLQTHSTTKSPTVFSLSLFFFLVFSFFLFFYFTHSTMFTNQTHNHGSESLVPFETPFISIIGLILDNHIYKPSHHSSLF